MKTRFGKLLKQQEKEWEFNMKHIKKGIAPAEFTKYIKKKGASYKDLSERNHKVKDELRESLFREQGYICCYCGSKLEDRTTIEHLMPKSNYPKLELDYNNLVLSCNGGRNKSSKTKEYPLFCDASKNNNEIYVLPTNENCESRFYISEDCEIYGLDEDAEKTIKILNLNNAVLKNKRKYAIESIKWYPEDKKREIIDDIYTTRNGKLDEYCFYIKLFLKEQLLSTNELVEV